MTKNTVEYAAKFEDVGAEFVEYEGAGHHLTQKNPNNKHC